jgi:hypothetical protein
MLILFKNNILKWLAQKGTRFWPCRHPQPPSQNTMNSNVDKRDNASKALEVAINDSLEVVINDLLEVVIGSSLEVAIGSSLEVAIGSSLEVAIGSSLEVAINDSLEVASTIRSRR